MRESKLTSQNGRWGFTLLAPDELAQETWEKFLRWDIALPGTAVNRGTVDGHEVWEIVPDPAAAAAVVRLGGVKPLRGAKILSHVELQGNTSTGLLLVEQAAMFVKIGYKGRSRTTYFVNPDWTIREATTVEVLEWRAQNVRPVIVSRHPAAIEFIREKAGLPEDTPVIEQATEADVVGKVVYGNLPLNLAARALKVYAVEFRNPPRGAEYTVEDMRAAGATLRAYTVVRNYE